MTTSMKNSFLIAAVLAAAACVSGCGGSSSSTTDTTSAAAPASSSTTSNDAATSTDYCKDVEAAAAAKPTSQTIDSATREGYGIYAVAVSKIVASAPAEQQTFWKATQTLSQNIADDKDNDPTNAVAAQEAFAALFSVGAQVKTDCNIDITK